MKNCIKGFLFWIIGVIIFYFCSNILVLKWDWPLLWENNTQSITNLDKMDDSPDVYFIGTSHMQNSVSPMKLYQDKGIIAYNVGTSQQPVAGTYYFLKQLLDKKDKPRVVVYDVSNLFRDIDENGYLKILDSDSKINIEKIALFEDYFNDYGNEKTLINKCRYFLKTMFPFYAYHDRWAELFRSDFANDDDGYFMQGFAMNSVILPNEESNEIIDWFTELAIDNGNKTIEGYYNQQYFIESEYMEPSYSTKVSPIKVQYLSEMKELCEKNGCLFILTKIPLHINPCFYNSSWTRERYEEMKTLAEKLGMIFIDLTFDYDIGVDWSHDTCDAGAHLNLLGAEKVTDFWGNYLIEKCNLGPSSNKEYEKKLIPYCKLEKMAQMELSYDLYDYCKRISDYSGIAVIISVKDDMRTSLSEHDVEALRLLGFQSNFENAKYSDSFIAVIKSGVVEYEAFSNRPQEYETVIDNNNVIIRSSGYVDSAESSILINGKEYSLNQRGINFVVYDMESDLIVDKAFCDTWCEYHEVKHDVWKCLNDYQTFLTFEASGN